MNWRRPHHGEHEESRAERRRREDEAKRLAAEVPELSTLRIHINEVRQDASVNQYVKPVVVNSAPAIFEIRCTEPQCDGVHDLTRDLLEGLRRGTQAFEGDSPCAGIVGNAQRACDRVLHYEVDARYRDTAKAAKRHTHPAA